MMEMDQFDAGLRQMRDGMRRAHEAFDLADEGFIQAMEGLTTLVEARGSIHAQFTEMRDTIVQLQTLVLAQGQELTALRADVAALRAQINGMGSHD
jgi:hypothetical protein